MELSDWFKGFEKGIARLSSEQREAFFSECGNNCVKRLCFHSSTVRVFQTKHPLRFTIVMEKQNVSSNNLRIYSTRKSALRHAN